MHLRTGSPISSAACIEGLLRTHAFAGLPIVIKDSVAVKGVLWTSVRLLAYTLVVCKLPLLCFQNLCEDDADAFVERLA